MRVPGLGLGDMGPKTKAGQDSPLHAAGAQACLHTFSSHATQSLSRPVAQLSRDPVRFQVSLSFVIPQVTTKANLASHLVWGLAVHSTGKAALAPGSGEAAPSYCLWAAGRAAPGSYWRFCFVAW